MLRISCSSLLVFVGQVALMAACVPLTMAAQERAAGTVLSLIDTVNRPDLSKAVCLVKSSDGKFLYASCWNPGSLVVFSRDQKSGKLTHLQTIDGKPDLAGATSFALSSDGRLAVVSAFQSKKAILFRRDAESGLLTELDVAIGQGKGMEFPCGASFSADGKFVAVADGGRSRETSAVRTFRVDGEKLVEAGIDEGRNRCYAAVRAVAFHPDGKTLFAACCVPGSLVVADFDPKTGATKVRQILWAVSAGGHDFEGRSRRRRWSAWRAAPRDQRRRTIRHDVLGPIRWRHLRDELQVRRRRPSLARSMRKELGQKLRRWKPGCA